MEIKNKRQFTNLIKKYKSFSLSFLEERCNKAKEEGITYIGLWVLNKLTGFGFSSSCKLCCTECKYCMHSIKYKEGKMMFFCMNETYQKMEDAKTAKQLYDALQERVKYMKEILKIYEDGNKE